MPGCCSKDDTTLPQCVNCQGFHSANNQLKCDHFIKKNLPIINKNKPLTNSEKNGTDGDLNNDCSSKNTNNSNLSGKSNNVSYSDLVGKKTQPSKNSGSFASVVKGKNNNDNNNKFNDMLLTFMTNIDKKMKNMEQNVSKLMNAVFQK